MKSSARVLASRLSVGALCVGMAVGCVSARDEYVDYGSRIVDADNRVIDGMIVSTIPDITGDFFFAATPDLPDEIVFKLRVSYVFTPVTENTGRIDFVGQPLDHETLEPVGTDQFVASDVEVNTDATYDVPLVGTLPARANPLGTPVLTNAVIHGTIVSADFVCGTVTGTAGSLNLEGSEWGAPRITGATLPPQILRCADGPTR